jgi:hypothetical protein
MQGEIPEVVWGQHPDFVSVGEHQPEKGAQREEGEKDKNRPVGPGFFSDPRPRLNLKTEAPSE